MSEIQLQNLANKYDLRVQVLQCVTLVYSKLDQWLIECIGNNEILLKHFNNPRISFETHEQLKFYNNHANYEFIFKYIRSHDHSMLNPKKLRFN